MKMVYVVTGLELGWDCVVGVFDSNELTREELEECFPSEDYHIHLKMLETKVDDYE
jgi:hypothetical protein